MNQRESYVVGTAWERFWPKVLISDGCWEWTAGKDNRGYGRFQADGFRLAHRWAWFILNGPIPDGLELDHLCRNQGCVNPFHLEPVTHAVNVARAFADQTHCLRGHPYDAENTYRTPGGRRRCRQCKLEYDRIYREEHREQIREGDRGRVRQRRKL